jgi:hypothetical protein
LTNQSQVFRNADIACLLAAESETALQPLQKAYRRAARRAFLWPEEAYELVRHHRLLTEFSGVGPFLEKRILSWINLNPCGQGDMDQTSELDIVLGCFHSSLRFSTAAVRRQFTISTLYRFYGELRV